jgi:hypothetical protein
VTGMVKVRVKVMGRECCRRRSVRCCCWPRMCRRLQPQWSL